MEPANHICLVVSGKKHKKTLVTGDHRAMYGNFLLNIISEIFQPYSKPILGCQKKYQKLRNYFWVPEL